LCRCSTSRFYSASSCCCFGIAEHLAEGWVHDQGLLGGPYDIDEIGARELGASVLMLIVSFIPFFAFWEMGRVLGTKKLTAIFFSKLDVFAENRHRPS
jgi:hypothetical protein